MASCPNCRTRSRCFLWTHTVSTLHVSRTQGFLLLNLSCTLKTSGGPFGVPQLRSRPTPLHHCRVLGCWPCCRPFRYMLQTQCPRCPARLHPPSLVAVALPQLRATGLIALLPSIADFAPTPRLFAPPSAHPGGLERTAEEMAAMRTRTSTSASKSKSNNTKSNTRTRARTTTTRTRRRPTTN